MKRFFLTSYRVMFLAIAIGVFAAADSFAQGPLGQILNRMDAHNKALRSLHADVTMVKTNVQLNVNDTNIGSTSYLPKTAKNAMYVRVDWMKPVEEQVSVIGDKYELYRPRLNQVIQGKVDKAKNSGSIGGALGFMNMSKDQLKANYDVTFVAQESIKDGIETFHLLLKPKTATSYKTAELWVDGDGMPRQAKAVETNGDYTTVLLENIQKNVTLRTEIFTLKYDKKKVKIVTA